MENSTKNVAVIGAGPAGASAAYYLQQKGFNVIVFEKAPFVGGRTHGFDNGKVKFDTGASFFTNFYPLLKKLVNELGIEEEVIELERRVGLKYKDVLAEFTFGSLKTFWKLPFITTKDKWIMIWNTLKLTLKRNQLDLVSPNKLAKFDDASIADWATNDMSENVYQYLIKPGVEPFWYFSCEDVSRAMTTVLQGRAADAKFYTFRNGMSRISEKLLEKCDLHLSTSVKNINTSNNQTKIEYIENSQTQQINVDYVVMATPASTTAELLNGRLEGSSIGKFIKSQKYVHNVHSVYMMDEKDAKDLYAYYYPCGDWETPIGAIVLHKLKCPDSVICPKGKELVSVFILDEPSKKLIAEKNDEHIQNEIWKMAVDFVPELPTSAEHIALFKRKEAIPLHEVGRYKKANEIMDDKLGNIIFAGDYLTCATVEGALRSGRWAAAKITGEKIIF